MISNHLSKNDLIFNHIIIHHTSIYNFQLIDLLRILHEYLNENGRIMFFYSLCNGSQSKQSRKNFIRNQIREWTQLPIGNMVNSIDILDSLQCISHLYERIEMDLFQRKIYPIFGEHNIHYIILQKKD